MLARTVALVLTFGAGLADAHGARQLAFYVLVAAVPALSVAALACLAEIVDSLGAERGRPLVGVEATLAVGGLALAVVSAAARAPALADEAVPTLGVTALLGCVALLAVQAAVFVPRRLLAR